MKTITRFFLPFALALLAPSLALAGDHQVTSLTTGSVQTIAIPGPHCLWITIQNVSTGAQVNLGPDGGTQWTDPYNGKKGVDPTTGATGLGMWLPAGQSVTFYGPYIQGVPIRAIMATGTTTVNITTNDQGTTFPVN